MMYLCYSRVSTEEQGNEGFSIEAQENKIKSKYTDEYYGSDSIFLFYQDVGISGSIALKDRSSGAKLLHKLQNLYVAGTPVTVVTTKLDRLFRDASDALETTKDWNNKGINLVILDFGGESLNTSTPFGRMFLTVMAGFAEMERNLIAERTKNVMGYMKENKISYSKVPYGWLCVDGRLVKYEEEQRVIKLMKSLKESHGYKGVANILNEEGVRTKEGKEWYGSTVRYILNNDLNKED